MVMDSGGDGRAREDGAIDAPAGQWIDQARGITNERGTSLDEGHPGTLQRETMSAQAVESS